MNHRVIAALLLAASTFAPAPAAAQDASEIIVRLGRIEAENRRLNGRVEELEQQNRRLEDHLKRFQEDVEFRLSGAKPAPAAPGTPPRVAAPAAPRRGDAFDPAANPAAPGAPRPLGQTRPSPPLAGPRPGAPLTLPGATPPAAVVVQPAAPAPAAVAPQNPAVAAPTADARTDFDAAFGFIQRNEFEAAEIGFRQFLEAHPKSGLRGAAIYWLGESYHRRKMHREAAEQFLKVSTDHARSPNAAQGMLRLGQSLVALGAADQACATFREIDKRYPATGADFRKTVEREAKKAKCEGV